MEGASEDVCVVTGSMKAVPAFGIQHRKYEVEGKEVPDPLEGTAIEKEFLKSIFATQAQSMASFGDDDAFDYVPVDGISASRADRDISDGTDDENDEDQPKRESELREQFTEVLLNDDPVSLSEALLMFGIFTDKSIVAKNSWCFPMRKTRLHTSRKQEIERIFAATELDYDPAIHFRILKTCYETLSGKQCSKKIGSHWETIGFQGSDPRTDINRSIKIFAVLQLLALVETPLGKEMFCLSQKFDWPLAITSIALSRDCVGQLRFGRLNATCNRVGVFRAATEFHREKFLDFKARLERGEDRFLALQQTRKMRGRRRRNSATPAQKLVVFDNLDSVDSSPKRAQSSTKAAKPYVCF